MNIKLLAIILFTLPLVAFAAPSKPVKHNHDGRSHTHPLPNSGSNHNHKKAQKPPAPNDSQRSKSTILNKQIRIASPLEEVETCGDFLTQSETGLSYHYVWFRGLISGYNYSANLHRKRQISSVSLATFQHYMNKACKDKPLDSFMVAIFGLIKDLEKRS